MGSEVRDFISQFPALLPGDVLLWRWFGLTAWIYNQAEWLDQHLSGDPRNGPVVSPLGLPNEVI
jgi:hypothetical protein